MVEAYQDRWLSLGEASAMLNVHPSTLRRWADGGLVPCQRTPGGHRRFSRQALLPLLDGSSANGTQDGEEPRTDDAWPVAWGDDGQPEPLREPWQRLGGVVLQYLVRADDDRRLESDARALGRELARHTLRAGGDLGHMVTDYLRFRSRLLSVAAGGATADAGTTLAELARFERVTGEALVGIVEGTADASEGAI